MEITQEELNTKYFLGVDLGFRMKWWQRLLVWFGLVKRGRFQDHSCSTVFKKLPNGNFEVVDINYF